MDLVQDILAVGLGLGLGALVAAIFDENSPVSAAWRKAKAIAFKLPDCKHAYPPTRTTSLHILYIAIGIWAGVFASIIKEMPISPLHKYVAQTFLTLLMIFFGTMGFRENFNATLYWVAFTVLVPLAFLLRFVKWLASLGLIAWYWVIENWPKATGKVTSAWDSIRRAYERVFRR